MLLGVLAVVRPPASGRSDALVVGVTYELKSLNPLYISGADRLFLAPLVYSRLVTATPEGDLVPEISTIVPTQKNGGISQDGLTITYHLRHDARWADGVPLTSRDVVFTHEADMNPKSTVIETYGDKEIASIVAPDAYTVRVRLKRRFAPFVGYFDRPLLPAHILDKFESLDKVEYNGSPIGSGPYRVAEWARGDHVTFVRSETFWGRKPSISKIVERTIPDATTLAIQLRSGDIDVADNIDPHGAELLAGRPDLQVFRTFYRFGLIIFNASDSRLSDVRVRRAITLAFDRKNSVRKATDGFDETEDPARALFGWAYDPSIKPVPYDPAAARKLLDAAGWKLGPDGVRARDGQRLQFEVITQAGHPLFATEATQMIQQEKAVGIALDVKSYVDQQFLLLTSDGPLWGGHFDIALTRFVGGGDPDADWLVGCDAGAKTNPYNFTHMCIPGIAPVLTDGVSTYDRARRTRDYRIVQKALNEWLPLVILSQSPTLSAGPQRLHGFHPSKYGGPFWNVTTWQFSR
jgi:peptide/nickel transport system substrate-binding protein